MKGSNRCNFLSFKLKLSGNNYQFFSPNHNLTKKAKNYQQYWNYEY